MRIKSILAKAQAESLFAHITESDSASIGPEEHLLIKKIASLRELLESIQHNYQTHLLAYYTVELAQTFHNYYSHHKVIDTSNINKSRARLLTITLVQHTLKTAFDLLGISAPEKCSQMNIPKWAVALFLTTLCLLAFNAKNILKIFKRRTPGIPVLMYHSIDRKGGRFSISPEEFRSQLEKLYKAGFITAPLSDILAKKEYLKHQRVVLLRFDDSRRNQFNYLIDKHGTVTIDPDCALGILLDFYKTHHSFGKNALFCIIATEGFHQPKYLKRKLLFLLQEGMELANHGYYHVPITHASPEEIDANFGKAMAYWHKILGSAAEHIHYVAPPYGAVPQRHDSQMRLRCFEYKGISYPQVAILYAGRAYKKVIPLPFCGEFNPYEIPCFEVTKENFDSILSSLA